jgi:hypothetical protein
MPRQLCLQEGVLSCMEDGVDPVAAEIILPTGQRLRPSLALLGRQIVRS